MTLDTSDPLFSILTVSLSNLTVDESKKLAKELGMDEGGTQKSRNRKLKKKKRQARIALEKLKKAQESDAKVGKVEAEDSSDDSDVGDEATTQPLFSEEELARLASFFKQRAEVPNKQSYEYFAIFDVEATCEENVEKPFEYPNEIIEFPVVLLCGRTNECVAEFQSYVKPTDNPKLSEFCTKLTGITQDLVDAAPPFTKVLARFEKWLAHFDDSANFQNTIFVTDGPWDLRDFIGKQCRASDIKRPKYMRKWVDIRHTFAKWRGNTNNKLNIDGMLAALNLKFEGRPHSGIDDSRNVARIVKHLVDDGVILEANGEVNSNSTKRGKKGRR